MADIAALTKLIEPHATAMGLRLVRVAMFGGKSDPTLQVMAERPDTLIGSKSVRRESTVR